MPPSEARRHCDLFDSVYSMLALVFILVACVELCDAATVVDVYRLIQYDISGVPFGSRLAAVNHHACSLHFSPAADLSRTVVMMPVRELNITFLKGNCRLLKFVKQFLRLESVDFCFFFFVRVCFENLLQNLFLSRRRLEDCCFCFLRCLELRMEMLEVVELMLMKRGW